jgi:glycosyltransferase involved in cell wall biosynthesis
MSNIKLSVLVCTLPSRLHQLPSIIKELDKQATGKPVEILYLGDNGLMDVGVKRNTLVNMAQGDYVVHVDDDDRITSDYIDYILAGIGDRTVDSVVFDVEITINGKDPKKVKYGKDLVNCKQPYGYDRMTNHIMCVKRSIAVKHPFMVTGRAKDGKWGRVMATVLKSEARIDKVLYYYDFYGDRSEVRARYKKFPDLYPKER